MDLHHAVAPLVGAWIEIKKIRELANMPTSLLSWERGLKSGIVKSISHLGASLLSWERGLKSSAQNKKNVKNIVAPLVGAWIEIRSTASSVVSSLSSLLSWERGLKYHELAPCEPIECRSSRGSVD